MSINKLKAEKLLTFNDGVEYKARMSLDTIIRIEQSLSISIVKVGKLLSEADLSVTQIVQIITLAVRAGGNDVKEKDIKKLISDIGLLEGIKMAGELITLALNVDDESDSEDEKKSESETS